jgi:hypothetical protein
MTQGSDAEIGEGQEKVRVPFFPLNRRRASEIRDADLVGHSRLYISQSAGDENRLGV